MGNVKHYFDFDGTVHLAVVQKVACTFNLPYTCFLFFIMFMEIKTVYSVGLGWNTQFHGFNKAGVERDVHILYQ